MLKKILIALTMTSVIALAPAMVQAREFHHRDHHRHQHHEHHRDMHKRHMHM